MEEFDQKPIRQVAAAIVFHAQRILVARRAAGQSQEGMWEFPGGKLEWGETPQECIVRELAEELSLAVEPGPTFAESRHIYPGGAINLIAVLAQTTTADVSLTVHDAIKWLAPAELLSVDLAPADIPIAEQICRHFVSVDDELGDVQCGTGG